MNKTMKKALSLVLMMIMVLSSVPMSGLAVNVYCESNGHQWGTYTTKVAATCTKGGVEVASCTRFACDATTERATAVNRDNHNEINMPRVEPTCDRVGNEAGVVCGDCNAVISGYTKLLAKGHKSIPLAAVPATCTTDGNEAGTECEVCHTPLSGGKKIEKTGHNWELYSKVPATCTNPGSQQDICKNCSILSEVKTIESGHVYGSWRTTTAATCSATGTMERTCQLCQKVDTQTIEKLAHTVETVAATDPGCESTGTTAGKRCKVCKATIEGAVTIPAKGHTVVTVPGKPATCDTAGTSDSTYCSVCGAVFTQAVAIQPLGHNIVADTVNSKPATCTATGIDAKKCTNTGCTYTERKTIPVVHEANWVTITQVTCTTDGKRRGTCTKCGMDVTETVPATGHTVNDLDWRTTKSPTCTAEGTKSATCTVCKKTATKSIPATGHNIVVKNPAVAPTCTTEGATESKHCSICKVVTTASQPVAKVAHTFGEWVVKSAPTCAVAGVEEATCKVCKTKETRVADRLAHTEKEIPAVAATCTTAGSTAGIECTVCKAKVKEVTVIDALGHDFVLDKTASFDATCELPGREKGKCSRCDATKDEEIKAKGHTEEVIPGSAADCETSGLSEGKRCTVCEKILVEQEQIPALGHKLIVDTSKSIPATCTSAGKDYLICTGCQYTENKDTALLEHTYGDWTVTKQASCAEEGEQTRVCSACNTIDTQSIPSFGGHEVVALPGKEATCTEAGLTSGSYCGRCETIFDAQVEIQPTGHVLGDEPELVPATTEEDGQFGNVCTVCHKVVDGQTIAKIDKDSIKLSTKVYYYDGKTKTPAVTVKDSQGNDLIKGEDYDVIYSSGRKNTGKYTAQITFKGNYAGETVLEFSINPVKSAKVSYENKGDHILIKWDKVTGATGYTIYIYKNSESGTTRKALKTVGAGTTSYKLTKDYNGKALAYDEDYRIGIVSRTKAEDGTILTSKNPAFKTVTRKLVKPTLTVTTTTGKATLKWTNVADESGYEIVYATKKDGTYKSLGTTKANVVTLTKSLTRGGTFYFKVRAYKTIDGEKVYSNYSSVKSIKIK